MYPSVSKLPVKAVYLDVSGPLPPYRCPCCAFRTLSAPGAMHLCPVCWWEDDGQEDGDAAAVRLTVNGQLSLAEARDSYARCGAAHPRFLPYVRRPNVTEQ
jgi:hypothetical protein